MAEPVDGDKLPGLASDDDDYIEVDLQDAPEESGEESGIQKQKPATSGKTGSRQWTCLCPYICVRRRRLEGPREPADERSNGLENNNQFGDDSKENDIGTSAATSKSKGRRQKCCSCCQNVCPFVCIKRSSTPIKHSNQNPEKEKEKSKTMAKWARPKLVRPNLRGPKPGKKPTESHTDNHAYVNEASTAHDERPASPLDEVDQQENPYLETAEIDLEASREDEEEDLTPDIIPLEQAPDPPPEAAPTLDVETVSNASSESYLVVELPNT